MLSRQNSTAYLLREFMVQPEPEYQEASKRLGEEFNDSSTRRPRSESLGPAHRVTT